MPGSSGSHTDPPGDGTEDKGVVNALRRRLKAPRQLSLTRAGKFFLLITLAIGFGAINTGNNLLFLLLGMQLSVILASGVLSEAVLRNLTARRRLPTRLRAGHKSSGSLQLTNQGRWPALSVIVSEQNPRVLEGPDPGRVVGPKPIPWWKFWRRQTGEDRRPIAAAYCMRLGAGDRRRLPVHYELPTRGRYRLPGLQVKTRFPFGLFEKTRQLSAPATVTVLPDPARCHRQLTHIGARHGDLQQNRRGQGEDFYGLRDYRPGEDKRRIHWKTTARRGEPVVRETEHRRERAALVVFDNRAPSGELTDDQRRRFEEGIRHLAGLIDALDQRGFRLWMTSCRGDVAVDDGISTDAMLRHLAVIEPAGPDRPSPLSSTALLDRANARVHIGFDPVGSPAESTSEVRLSLNELIDSEPPTP